MLKNHVKGYQGRFKKYGVDARALQWTSRVAQGKRLRELVRDIDFEGKGVLDVGCGFGDIIPFIQKKAKKFEYIGVDLVPEFIKVARERYPEGNFIVRDYFEKPMRNTFDIVLSSGTLNANIKNALFYRKMAIKLMFEHTRIAVAFNMAGGHPQPENKKGYRVYYVDSLEVLKFCLRLTSRVILRQHYNKKDFTVVLFRQ